jgi:hypothetical protein
VDFSEARDLFVIIFQIPRSDYKFLDCRLILEKNEGPKCKMSKIGFSGNYFPKGNMWTKSTSPWTPSGAGPRWTTVTVSEKARRRTAGTAPPRVEPHRG